MIRRVECAVDVAQEDMLAMEQTADPVRLAMISRASSEFCTISKCLFPPFLTLGVFFCDDFYYAINIRLDSFYDLILVNVEQEKSIDC